MMASSTVAADEYLARLTKAMTGDYGEQRNIAFMLNEGDGIQKNPSESCAWRIVIATTQGVNVTDSDIANLERCIDGRLIDAAVPRAQTLSAGLPQPQRTLADDIEILTGERCSPKSCAPPHDRFQALYPKAVRGEIAAIRTVIDCLSTGCEQAASHNLFQACVWSFRLKAVGGPLTAPDRVKHATTCGYFSAQGQAAFNALMPAHMAGIDLVRASMP